MLAVKLHKNKKPWLGKGSHLVPIVSWDISKVHIRIWIGVLNQYNPRGSNDAIRYITLVRIPQDHPVALFLDWEFKEEVGYKNIRFRPLREVPSKIKRELKKWWNSNKPQEEWLQRGYDWRKRGPKWPYPELILGKPLPSSCVIWTKDVRLLYYRRKGRRKNRARLDCEEDQM